MNRKIVLIMWNTPRGWGEKGRKSTPIGEGPWAYPVHTVPLCYWKAHRSIHRSRFMTLSWYYEQQETLGLCYCKEACWQYNFISFNYFLKYTWRLNKHTITSCQQITVLVFMVWNKNTTKVIGWILEDTKDAENKNLNAISLKLTKHLVFKFSVI